MLLGLSLPQALGHFWKPLLLGAVMEHPPGSLVERIPALLPSGTEVAVRSKLDGQCLTPWQRDGK